MMEATHPFPEQSSDVRNTVVPRETSPLQSQQTFVAPPPTTPTTQVSSPLVNAEPIPTDPEEKKRHILQTASTLFNKKPDWVTFYRELLGKEGLARRGYPTLEQMAQFEKTPEYIEIQSMLARLRSGNTPSPDEDDEPTKVITVRLPKSLHEALRSEAHERNTSMNKLCISKLLQLIDQQLVPNE